MYGTPEERAGTAAALASATGVIRAEVGRQTGLRHTPSLEFRPDVLPDNARNIEDLVARAKEADAAVAQTREGAQPAGDADPYRVPAERRDDDDDEDGEEADGGPGDLHESPVAERPRGILAVVTAEQVAAEAAALAADQAADDDWAQAIEIIGSATQVCLACHIRPDGDALGSMLAVAHALRARAAVGGQAAEVVASFGDRPFEIPPILRFLPGTDLLCPPEAYPAKPEVMVTFDASSADRLGLLEGPAEAAGELIVLDHHASNTRFGTLHLVDAAAPATAVLAHDLITRLGLPVTRDVAYGLYTGIVTDTGSFKYPGTSPRIHELGCAAAAHRHRPQRGGHRAVGTGPRSATWACCPWCSAGRCSRRPPRAGTGWCGPRSAVLTVPSTACPTTSPSRSSTCCGAPTRRTCRWCSRRPTTAWLVSARSKGKTDVAGPAPWPTAAARLAAWLHRGRRRAGRTRGAARRAGRRGRLLAVTAPSGLVVVDKPGGLTSHDVVARVRRLAGTRRVGHAGTLDPMATGVLLVGVEKATRLLGYLALTEKEYAATVRLGQATDSGDADGQVTATAPARGITRDQLVAAAAAQTGEIDQVPPGISAIKVGGKRAYQLARAGQAPELAARRVTVRELAIGDVRPDGDRLDVDIRVTCSSGTYIRAIARDLGDTLGVGGHLTALRRTRVGPYRIEAARTLDELAVSFAVTPLPDAAAAAFPRRDLTAQEADQVSHGARLPAAGTGTAPVAAFGPDGALIALLTEEAGQARSLAVFVP